MGYRWIVEESYPITTTHPLSVNYKLWLTCNRIWDVSAGAVLGHLLECDSKLSMIIFDS